MCEAGEMEILEDNSTAAELNMLLYQHTPVHIRLSVRSAATPGYRLLSSLRENQSISICVYKNSKKVDGFMYELLIMHILDMLGAQEYLLSVQVFEDVADLYLLKSLVFAIESRYRAGLEIRCGKALQILLKERVVYTSDVF
jgi:hypothetical protein